MRCTCGCTGRPAQRCFSRYRSTLQMASVAAAVVTYCFVLGSFAVAKLRAADTRFSLTYLNVTIDEPKLQDTNAVWETENYNYNYDPGYLEEIYEMRRERVWEVCVDKGLNTRGQPNAWEFFIDKDHHLVWCSIFKAASSTWMYHFNILAGYNERFLRRTRKTPMSLARARFPRPSVQQLQETLPHALSFLIVREPYERLLSAYRNKIEGAKNPYYRKLSKHIAQHYRYKQDPMTDVPESVRSGPTFPEFVDYIINSKKFDEHWAPYHSFCTPCHVNFTVIAKMETLDRDEEYIIHKAGLQRLLLPSHYRYKPRTAINKARDGKATAALVEKYYSQLTKKQMEKLHKIYGTDFEMFDYNATKYFTFTQSEL
ncbi:carbohydrate sulfotransferase 11-like [Schistocerca cancellata]|uniref:carbohydrate sulfotransferase 11-like n=1 Tax=Schistocerca cancellata TaxID=274614 RepID=UPI002119B1DF|nr:carbohydrate sulfotransferase 11-like [Schistocerca cancellata]